MDKSCLIARSLEAVHNMEVLHGRMKISVPTVSNNGYDVKFTPNAHTLENYETIESTTSKIQVPVAKANPTVVLTSKVENEAEVLLFASIEKAGYGDYVTGSIKFVDSTNGSDVEIEDTASVELKIAVATYVWKDMPEEFVSNQSSI